MTKPAAASITLFRRSDLPPLSLSDRIRIDFGQREVGPAAATYLVERHGAKVWRGTRRLAMSQSGLVMDATGRGSWIPVDPAWRLRIVGRVESRRSPA